MSDLHLFSTSGCHLCEIAEALLHQHRLKDDSITWTVVDIADDDRLFERYGWLIPVLAVVGGSGSCEGTREGSCEGTREGPGEASGDLIADRVERELRWPFDEHGLAEFLRHDPSSA